MTKHGASSARGRRVAELRREYVECKRRYLKFLVEATGNAQADINTPFMVPVGDRDEVSLLASLPDPEKVGAALDGMLFAEAALEALEALPKAGRPPASDWYDAFWWSASTTPALS